MSASDRIEQTGDLIRVKVVEAVEKVDVH